MKLRVFPHALFRTPCFSAHTAQIEELFPNPVFQEALFLASPDLYAEKKKADESGKLPYEEKLRRSLYKYASRSMTRPTPFGLFAGCSLAAIGEWTNINIKQQEAYQRCTRLDMHYMGALIQSLEKEKDIRLQLHYYPNDSLYELGGRLRYVEYYYKDARRVHQIASIEASDYVQHLLNAACEGKSIQQLATLLFDEEISIDEATDFIHELSTTRF